MVTPDAPVRSVLKTMTEVRAGAAVVSDENGQLLGIFTHGDFVRHFQSDAKIAERLVGDLMTLNPVTVHQGDLTVRALVLDQDGTRVVFVSWHTSHRGRAGATSPSNE